MGPQNPQENDIVGDPGLNTTRPPRFVNLEEPSFKVMAGFMGGGCVFRLLSKSLPNLLTRCSDCVGMVASVISKQNLSRTSSSLNMRELDFVGLKLILVFERSFSRPFYIHLHNQVLLGGCRMLVFEGGPQHSSSADFPNKVMQRVKVMTEMQLFIMSF